MDKLIMRLPPHVRQGCITNTRDNETIEEHIKRIPTSEGLYKMSWILAQKAESLELDKYQREITRAKARSARDRAMRLLAIELSIRPDTIEHVVANCLAQQKALFSIKADVEREELRAIRAFMESIADASSNKDDNIDGKEEEDGNEEVDSSG